MLNQLRLRSRMMLGYSIPVLLFFILTGFVYWKILKIFQTFRQVELTQSIISNRQILDDSYRDMVKSFRGYLLLNDDFFSD